MKFKSIVAAAAAVILSVFASSCTKDEANFNGEYKGQATTSVFGKPMDPVELTFSIANHKGGVATVVSPVIDFGRMKMPSLSIDVKVDGNNLSAAPFTIKAGEMNMVSKKGLKGSVIDNKLSLEFDIQPGEMPAAIEFKFEGTK